MLRNATRAASRLCADSLANARCAGRIGATSSAALASSSASQTAADPIRCRHKAQQPRPRRHHHQQTRRVSSHHGPWSTVESVAQRGYATSDANEKKEEWERLAKRGVEVNPCNSPRHPAAVAGVAPPDPSAPIKSVQASYDAHSKCFVCGNSHERGLGLKSYRDERDPGVDDDAIVGALRSTVVVGEDYQGLPGIVSTGVMDALMICHGAWQAGVTLMDKSVLPRPPLVLTKSFSMEVNDRLPPGTEIEITTKAVEVKDAKEPFRVKVTMELRAAGDDDHGGEAFRCATGEATYVKVGAVRSMW